MIVTLTPNPSVDRTIAIPQLLVGEVHRATSSRIDPGGKGINVTRALVAQGGTSVAVLPVGGPEGALMGQLLDRAGVPHRDVAVAGTTRMNIAAVEPDGTTTKLNEAGPHLDAAELRALLAEVDTAIAGADWVVGCGSLPPGAPESLYADLVATAHRAGVRVAIDSSGAPLTAAVAAGPDLIKPNLEELEELVDSPLHTVGEVVAASQELVASGIGTVVVSLGGDGAVLVDADRTIWAGARISDPLSTVGAGDCLLAGLLFALDRGDDPQQALITGTRWGSAAVRLPGSAVPGPDDLAGIDVTVSHHPDPATPLQ